MAGGGIDLIVSGAEDYRKQARKLDDIGTRKLKAAIRREVTQATKPTRVAIKNAARADLPKKGKLNRWAAVTPSAKTRFSGKDSGVTVSMRKKGHDLRALNRGRLRHPLFGNRNFWFNQDVKPGFFTDTIAADADGIRKRVFDAIDDTVNRSI